MMLQTTPRPAQGVPGGESLPAADHTATGDNHTTYHQRKAAEAKEKMKHADNARDMERYYYEYAYHCTQERLLKECYTTGCYMARVEYLEEKLYRITSRAASPDSAPPRPRQTSRIVHLRPVLSPAPGGRTRPGKGVSETKTIKQRLKP